MHEKGIPADAADRRELLPAEQDDMIDRAILELLLDSDEPGLWSPEELALQTGNQLATTDSLSRLQAAGLIHRCDGFVFASRPAVQFGALNQL